MHPASCAPPLVNGGPSCRPVSSRRGTAAAVAAAAAASKTKSQLSLCTGTHVSVPGAAPVPSAQSMGLHGARGPHGTDGAVSTGNRTGATEAAARRVAVGVSVGVSVSVVIGVGAGVFVPPPPLLRCPVQRPAYPKRPLCWRRQRCVCATHASRPGAVRVSHGRRPTAQPPPPPPHTPNTAPGRRAARTTRAERHELVAREPSVGPRPLPAGVRHRGGATNAGQRGDGGRRPVGHGRAHAGGGTPMGATRCPRVPPSSHVSPAAHVAAGSTAATSRGTTASTAALAVQEPSTHTLPAVHSWRRPGVQAPPMGTSGRQRW